MGVRSTRPERSDLSLGKQLISKNLVFDQNTTNDTADVGSKPGGVSWVGALDMAATSSNGSAASTSAYPYNANDGREDLNDTTSPRVYRGGNQQLSRLRRGRDDALSHLPQTERDWFLGFRCAQDA